MLQHAGEAWHLDHQKRDAVTERQHRFLRRRLRHNQQNSNGWVVSLNGTSAIQGSVAIDGAGGLLAGSSGVNVVYDPFAFSKIVSYGNAGIIQNTWREITG